jgi:tRNA G18 (ribose-2'-O)-methylase SpoU
MIQKRKEILVVLPDIRSSYNVGSVFRTCDAVGVSKIFLTGFTPCPLDKFKRSNKEIAKTALGAEKSVEWEYREDMESLLVQLKKEGFQIIAVEQSENSVDYKKVKPAEKCSIIFGSEVGGLPKEILKQCDIIAEIPMHGEKESLNVSVAAGVVLYRMFDI